jgi:hypothetical protein
MVYEINYERGMGIGHRESSIVTENKLNKKQEHDELKHRTANCEYKLVSNIRT